MFYFFFFFSSRRRHTRWNCDWSSDVCSSDLLLYRRTTSSTRQACPKLSYQASALIILLPALIVARESKSKDCRQPITSEDTIGSSLTPISSGLRAAAQRIASLT